MAARGRPQPAAGCAGRRTDGPDRDRHTGSGDVPGAPGSPDAHGDPGALLSIDESGMLVACGSGGGVRIGYVHPAGKRRLAALDWAQGRGIAVGDVLGASV